METQKTCDYSTNYIRWCVVKEKIVNPESLDELTLEGRIELATEFYILSRLAYNEMKHNVFVLRQIELWNDHLWFMVDYTLEKLGNDDISRDYFLDKVSPDTLDNNFYSHLKAHFGYFSYAKALVTDTFYNSFFADTIEKIDAERHR